MLSHLTHYNAFKLSDNLPTLAEHFREAGEMHSAIKYLQYADFPLDDFVPGSPHVLS